MAKGNSQKKSDGSALDFEAQLWAAADKMRGHMDASEYKHVCLGLIFLKYISDAFEEKREQLLFGFSDPKSEWFIKDEPQRAEAAENRDEYLAANVFWLPPEARWHTIKAKAKSPEIGKVIDDAMGAIERENPTLKGVLPRDYARPSLDKQMREGQKRGEKLGLTDDEVAFYDALETNDSAVKVLGEPTLKNIARELVAHVRKSVTIDWTLRENARAQIRVLVRRILRKYGYDYEVQTRIGTGDWKTALYSSQARSILLAAQTRRHGGQCAGAGARRPHRLQRLEHGCDPLRGLSPCGRPPGQIQTNGASQDAPFFFGLRSTGHRPGKLQEMPSTSRGGARRSK